MRIVEWLLEQPAIYATWQAPFVARKFAPVARRLRATQIRRVLDVGCGPGTNASYFTHVDYVGLDINERYLAIARSKGPGQFICVDVETADISSLGTFDTILINSFLHHLPDASVARTLEQVRSALSPMGTVHILELVRPEKLSIPTVLARLDRGRYARRVSAWKELFEAHFERICLEPYTVSALWAMVYFQGRARSCGSR